MEAGLKVEQPWDRWLCQFREAFEWPRWCSEFDAKTRFLKVFEVSFELGKSLVEEQAVLSQKFALFFGWWLGQFDNMPIFTVSQNLKQPQKNSWEIPGGQNSYMLPGTLLTFGNGFKSKILQSFLHCNLPGTLIAGSVSLVVIGVVVVVVTSALQVLLCWSPFAVQNIPVAVGPLYYQLKVSQRLHNRGL